MRALSALAALALLAGCARAPATSAGTTVLTYASPYGPTHPFSRADATWIRFVEAQSHGRLRIRPIWSGALLSSDMSMEELRHGVADIGLVTPIYARGGAHLIRVQTGFYSGARTPEAQVELYGCIAAAAPEVARELNGLEVLAVQGGTLPGLVTRSRPVRRLADLQGLRLRAPAELISVLRDLGADPVNMPMGDVYSALAKGVLDGVVAPADTLKSLHFAEVARFYTTLAVPRGAYPARVMATRRWDRLPPALRQVLLAGIPVWQAALAGETEKAVAAGMAEAKARHVAVLSFDGADQARFDALYLADAARNARALGRYGIDGAAALRAARASIRPDGAIQCPKRVTA